MFVPRAVIARTEHKASREKFVFSLCISPGDTEAANRWTCDGVRMNNAK